MILAVVLLILALATRAACVNRHVRGRLTVSAVVFAATAAAAAAAAYAPLPSELVASLRGWIPIVIALAIAFGVINAGIALALNPWRTDGVPDHFPHIVQDTILIVLFAIAATLILRERILATTAVGAVIVGFALQDTLGNFFAGLAIQVERPFRVGHWVTLGGVDGRVAEITWRATKIRTKAGNFVVVPNSVLARDTITNYSEPTVATRIDLQIGASYDDAPNDVRAAIFEAVRDEPLLAPDHAVEVLVDDFADFSINYKVRVWITDFGADSLVRDRIRTRIYYVFRRRGLTIPFPTQVYVRRDAAPAASDHEAIVETLRATQLFDALDDEQRGALARAARRASYAAGEVVVRQGEPGASMFVVERGALLVSVTGAAAPLAQLGPGDVFGEMSLLTGEPRVATVATAGPCELLEIAADGFREFVLANPAAVDRISAAVASRRAELAAHRTAGVEPTAPEPPGSFAARVRRFLGLTER
ncbi:MAG: mechanosensitive ion channel domain-containing protein [Betaproteobacteria bacterium]